MNFFLLNIETNSIDAIKKNKYPTNISRLFLLLKEGGIYIHSNAVPLGDFDPAYTPFVNKFEEMNIKFERVSCSGHAHPYDLIKIINLIKPKLLVPIHSYRPEKLYNESGDRLLPEKKQTI